MLEPGWEFWIDRGGTFTDVVARRPDGELLSAKYLSEDPARYADAALFGIRDILRRNGVDDLKSASIAAIKLGTTVATNALLERSGDPTVLAITAGFGDALKIGYQNRPDIFALNIQLPEVLYERVIEVDERVDAHGQILTPLHETRFEDDISRAFHAGLRSVAIVLLHGFQHPAHELRCAQLARRAGFTQISVSHQISSLVKLIARGDTAVADAYLTPALKRYVDSIEKGIEASASRRLFFMQSSGGLTDAAGFSGHNSILSGPAGGVVGMAKTAGSAGVDRVIGFDMGGTSTDVALYDGAFERDVHNLVAGVRLQTPMMTIHTVAAGGGSCLVYRDARLQVGPASAGALPGPACYGRDGPLAVTDIHAFQGKLQPDFFPRLFGADGRQGLDPGASRRHFESLAQTVSRESGRTVRAEEIADGFLTIAVDKMALAIRRACLSRGIDVDRFHLSSFGGAAGQHACKVAETLGIGKILVHPRAGVLSALGIGLADLTALRVRSVRRPLQAGLLDRLNACFAELRAAATNELEAAGLAPAQIRFTESGRLRYAGSDTSIEIGRGDIEQMHTQFETMHEKRFGFVDHSAAVIVESVMVEAAGGATAVPPDSPPGGATNAAPVTTRPVWFDRGWRDTPFFARGALGREQIVTGPAIIVEAHSTTVLEPGWQARLLPDGHLLLKRRAIEPRKKRADTRCDPVRLELFNNLFMHIAEQMGLVLQKTARSVNIKERLDFSCAIFDAAGQLIANAPHMPVHLGSMGESVRAVITAGEPIRPGDSFLLNDPYAGGTHLPDLTVVTPWFGSAETPAFYLASRGHHADVGGTTPGSMPADSMRIEEEGVLISTMPLVRNGRFLERPLREKLLHGPWPARNSAQNIADLKAQLAANAFGAGQLASMIAEHSEPTALAYAGHVQDNAAAAVREVIGRLNDGRFECVLDTGQTIRVSISVRNGRARVDFGGTSVQQDNNFNAPAAVCRAAVLYVFRTLVDRDIPMNAGCMRAIDLVIPRGSMLKPRWPAAVAAGNVETSMCICDALYGALGVLGSSQGTMNNLTFGDGELQYYETLCGGAGAGDGFDGCSSVHTHMTNSRLTDPEVIEIRFPVLVRRFAIRKGSGGDGQYRGGDGIIREIEFRKPMQVSILSNRRKVAPFGIGGGADGKPGINTLYRSGGERTVLSGTDSVQVEAGDRIEIRTPGGGGFGQYR